MINCLHFLEEVSILLNNYKILTDEREIKNLNIDRIKKGFFAILGDYDLDCICMNILYKKKFKIILAVDVTKKNSIPILYLEPGDIPNKFTHIYKDSSCCLGVDHEIISSWGDKKTAKDFFQNIVDIFLINLIAFKNTGKCISGERPHGAPGIRSYYSQYFKNLNDGALDKILIYIFKKVKRNKKIKCHNQCPCGSELIIRKCHKDEIVKFTNEVLYNSDYKYAFIRDVFYGYKGEVDFGK